MKFTTACFTVLAVLAFSAMTPLVQAEPNSNNRDPEPDILSTPARSHYEDDLTKHFDIEPIEATKWNVSAIFRYDRTLGAGAAKGFANMDDLWPDGYGITGELGYDMLDAAKIHFGPYGSLGIDSLSGKSFSGFDNLQRAVDVSPDNMTIYSIMAGFQVSSNNDEESGFFWKGSIGGGVCHYKEVDVDLFVRRTGILSSNTNFYDQTNTWAFEGSLRLGWANHSWAFFTGAGVRAFGHPYSGGSLNPGAGTLTLVPIEFGIEYKW